MSKMLKFTRIIQNVKGAVSFQSISRLHYSTASIVELQNVPSENNKVSGTTSLMKHTEDIPFRNNMVAAAFASLQKESGGGIETPVTDSRISSATSINDLLSISEGGIISRRHSLKVISVLAEWSMQGKVKLADFETDRRFIALCRVLTKSNLRQNKFQHRSEDLSTILNITADDEAAKLVTNITIPQVVKVLATLSQKKRRSIILLRALSFNITKSIAALDLKQCGDILYSMAVLNYPDENLLRRVCIDACKGIDGQLQKSAVLGSILTSLGLLKYKDNSVLEASCQWMLNHPQFCRPQDLFALFITMAMLNYEPPNAENFFEKLIPQLKKEDAPKAMDWLDLVWSLILLNQATPEQVSTVLSKEFTNLVNTQDEQSVPHKLKLLNIDSATKYLLSDYNGPNLDNETEIRDVKLLRSKEKEEMSNSIIECLKNLVSDKHIRTKIDTKMGFYIDVECYLDDKCNPVLPEHYKELPEQRKIAILALDYHDMCKGSAEPTGIIAFAMKLLDVQGYRVLTVPYTEYKQKDKLVERVRYLESKLKNIVKN